MVRKHRDCTTCIAYCNMLHDKSGDYKCGLGFECYEDFEQGGRMLKVAVHPVNDECEKVPKPRSKKEFVETAASLGIEWDIEDVVNISEFGRV